MAISIGDALLKLGIDSKDFDKGIADAQKSLETSLGKMKDQLRAVGATFTSIGAAGIKFSSDARNINADLTGIGITIGATTKQMRDLALSVSDVSFPLQDVTDTFDVLSRAGVKNTDDMKASAKAFDALADATGSSASTIADELVPVFKAFGEQIPTTTGELDKFTYLAKNTNIDVGDFANTVQRLAPVMQDAGISMDDAVVALIALGDKGITGRTAITQLNDAITKSVENHTSLATELGLTSTEFDNYKTKLDDAKGSTDAYAQAAGTQYGIVDKLKQAFSEVTLRVGSLLTPLEPLLGVMTTLGPVMLFFSTSMGMAAAKTVLATGATIAHTVALLATKIAVIAATAAQWLWNAAITANPIGLIIIAIAALIAGIVLLIKNWDSVKSAFIDAWNAIKDAWDKVVDFFKDIWEKVKGIFEEYWPLILLVIFPPAGIVALFIKYWDPIKEFFTDLWDDVTGIFTSAWDTLTGLVTTAYEALKTAWNAVVDFFQGLWDTVTGIFTTAWNGWVTICGNIVDAIKSAWSGLTGFFTDLWNGIVSTFKTIINGLLTGVEGFVNFFIKGINFIIEGLNKINFSLPSWIPGIGGKSFGINISAIGEIALPRLAEGGIVTSPTAAMIGESGPEIVAPLDRLQPSANITYVTVKVGEQTLVDIIDRSLDRRKRIQQVI